MSNSLSPIEPEPIDSPRLPRWSLSWHRRIGLRSAMLVVFIAALLTRLVIGIGPAASLLLFALLIVSGTAGLISALIRRRGLRSEPMLWVVANAIERDLPLEPGLEACGALCGRAMQTRARAVIHQLEQGATLSQAMTRARGAFPKPGLLFLRMDWDGPRLGAALRDLSRRRSETQPFRNALTSRISYLTWTTIALQIALSFMTLFIFPKIEMIFFDFGIAIPEITQWTIHASRQLGSFPVLPVLLTLEFLIVCLLFLWLFEPLSWNVWPIDRLLLRRHGAMVLRALAGEVALGRPMSEALGKIAQAYPSRLVRRRTRRARALVDRGVTWTRCLAGVGLIRPVDAAMLDAADRLGNLSWALDDLADGIDRRHHLRLIVWGQVLFPVAVLLTALPVFVIAVAYFYPLVTIIQTMT